MPPASNPSLLIPRPLGGASPSGSDRERVTQLEVQAQAMRAQLQRMEAETAQVHKRAEAAEARVLALVSRLAELESKLGAERTELGAKVEEALARADRPVALQSFDERVERLDQLTTQVRAGLKAAQTELAEHARLFESRKDRLDSMDTRIARLETDARITELRRGIEALDLRMSAIDAGRDAALLPIATRVTHLEAMVAEARTALATKAEAPAEAPRRTKKTRKPTEEPEVDALEALKGVGAKYAKLLREHGVTEPAQIAEWTDADLTRIASALGLPKKRLEKLGWIEAAKAVAPGR